MSKTTSIVIAALVLLGSWYFVFRGSNPGAQDSGTAGSTTNAENSEIKDGIQYVTITAKGGYSPKLSTAQAGIPTKLIIKTKGTFDCSSALVIKSLGYRGMLPSTGETEIPAGTPQAGDVIQGVCAMGMYNFAVNFK